MTLPAASSSFVSPSAGRVRLSASWQTGRCMLSTVQVSVDRPVGAAVLVGKTPDEAIKLVPRLFSLCGQAQRSAAAVALEAAATHTSATRACAPVLREAVAEHLWRLLLDWPAMLNAMALTPDLPDRITFARWYKRLRAAEPLGHADLLQLQLLVAGELGDRVGRWQERLQAAMPLKSSVPTVLPVLPPDALAEEFGNFDVQQAHRPLWQGQPAETGAIACVAGQAVGLAVRLGARWTALQDNIQDLSVAEEGDAAWSAAGGLPVTGVPFDENAGIAGVQTARGLLIHRVRLGAGKIASYQIIAPTEWNFHPQSHWLTDLAEWPAETPEMAENWLRCWALAIDPCVPVQVELDRIA